MKIVVMGAPGSGKGTQSPIMKERYGICHLSSGDMLREAVASKTPNGLKAKAAMDAGQLVTDDIVFGIIQDGMKKPECAKGYIIDGLPRTIGQAQRMYDLGIRPDKVLLFEVPDAVIIERTSGRWIHRSSGRTYHDKFAPPKKSGFDDITNEPLIQRADDKKDIVTKRLALYHKELAPIAEFYKGQGVFEALDGNRQIMQVKESVTKALDPLQKTAAPWYKLW